MPSGLPPCTRGRARRAFALAELVGLLVIMAIAFCLALLACGHPRRLAKLGEDLAHMRQIAASTSAYAADNDDKVWGFSWRANTTFTTPWTDLNGPFPSDAAAAAAQMAYIARTAGGRTQADTPLVPLLFPYLTHSQMVLAAYLGDAVPTRLFVSAADQVWNWANDPLTYTGSFWRLPYTTGFRYGMALFDQSPLGSRVYPGPTYNTVYVPASPVIRQQPLSSVRHPSQKSLLHDRSSRYFLSYVWHMDPQARVPTLFMDGSASVRAFAEANLGADPNHPDAPAPLITYNPASGGIDPIPPGGSTTYYAGPMWTRMQLQGRDFGGPDVYP